uniref:Retrovirus-related Pol polyprotein from transposon TNT 1-94 n=1 Tax=Tanacetum cinerariifolium TaxID=118510 RepID=A0A6L2MJE5_TANCI|nr:hypothetical protein [Tanacetum cinerariifolium]
MNYLEEQIDGEAMIKSIQNGDQPLPIIAQVSLAGNAQNALPTLKDPKFWTDEEKKSRKIDRLARSLLIQGLPNDIYSLIDRNETAKDSWDALERQMRGSEYGEQDRKAAILYEYETFKATEGEQLLDTYLRYLQVINDLKKSGYKKDNCELNYKFLNNLQPEWKLYGTLMRKTKNLMDINIDALYNILKENQGDVNDALGYKKKAVVVTSDPLTLVAEKTKVSKQKEKFVVSSDSKGSGADDFSESKKITALLAKAFNRRKFYSKPTNNNLRTSSTSQFASKKQEFVKLDDKKEDKKAHDKKRDMSKVKFYNCKKEGHFTKDCKKVKIKDYNYYKTKMLLAKKDSDEQVLLAEDQAWMEFNKISSFAEETIAEVAYYTSESESESEYETLEYYDNYNNYGLFVNNDDDQEFFHDAIESASENFIENPIDSQKDYDKSEVDHNDSEEKEHLVKKKIDEQEILFDKMSRQLVEMNYNVLRLQEKILEKETKISELEGCMSNKDVEIEKCLERVNECENKLHKIRQTNQLIHMIMPYKDTLYHGQKGTGFENPSYFKKPKDLRPSLYDEKVIGLGYTLMFLIHSDEPLETEKFKRASENKIKFEYDYGNLNASYVNEKIKFLDDYFQEIINLDFEKIDSLFQQTSSLKSYVPNVILEKIIYDSEDEVVSLLEKEKANLERIESFKSKGFESSENAISDSENQSENDCHVVENECDKVENSMVITPGMFKLSVSQSVSPILMSKTSCDSKNVETSRPDIMHATCYCARYQVQPTEKHLTAVKWILRYLKDTIHMGLWYPKDTGFELTAFLDSDHVGCLDSRKSTSGGIQFLGGDKLMRTQLTDYGFYFDKIPMSCDSKAAIAISYNHVQHSRTKHIDVRYHFIKEKVEKGIVELFFVETEYQLADLTKYQLADLFTKDLPVERFKYLVRRLGMRCLTPAELEALANESA